MVCPAPGHYGRWCVTHVPCGCRTDPNISFEDVIRYVDGADCPRKAGEHLWVWKAELVVPVAVCKLEAAQDRLALYGPNRRTLSLRLPVGDYVIEEWALGNWLRVIVGDRLPDVLALDELREKIPVNS